MPKKKPKHATEMTSDELAKELFPKKVIEHVKKTVSSEESKPSNSSIKDKSK